jgi:sugar phosphate isomerase/epimerase
MKTIQLLLNSVALEPNRWTKEKIPHFQLEQLLNPITKAGFRFLELWQYHISRESEKAIIRIKSTGDNSGLSFPIIGLYPIIHEEGQERQNELSEVKKLFEYAKILGSKIIKIFVGNVSAKGISEKDYYNSVVFLSEMTNLAKVYQLTIAGETHENTLFEDVQSCQKLIQDVGANNFKICFQPINFKDTKQTISDYNELKDQVVHIHFQGRKNDQMELLQNADLDYENLIREFIQGEADYYSIEFVKDCIVENPKDFDVNLVLKNAQTDRDLIVALGNKFGSEINY